MVLGYGMPAVAGGTWVQSVPPAVRMVLGYGTPAVAGGTWIQSVPPAVAGGYAVGYEEPSASTTYPPATAGGTDSVQVRISLIRQSSDELTQTSALQATQSANSRIHLRT